VAAVRGVLHYIAVDLDEGWIADMLARLDKWLAVWA
jgi:hypothetical protein